MIKKILLLTLPTMLLSPVTYAANPKAWEPVTYTAEIYYSAKNGSYHNDKGTSSVLMMYENKSNKSVRYYRMSVLNSDCDRSYGKLLVDNLDGKRVMAPDYVSEGGSVAAIIGDYICNWYVISTAKL